MSTTQQRIQTSVGTPRLTRAKDQTFKKELRRVIRYVLHSPLALLGVVLVVLTLLITIFAPWISPHDPYAVNLNLTLTPPNATYWLGTDEAGRDLLSRIFSGAQTSVTTGVAVIVITLLFGSAVGMREVFENVLNWQTVEMEGIYHRRHPALPFIEALAAAVEITSTNPARLLRESERGALRTGNRADAILASIEGEPGAYRVAVHRAWLAGVPVGPGADGG